MADAGTIGVAIAGLGLVLNALNFVYTTRRVKTEALRQRVAAVIDEITAYSRVTAEEMQRHLAYENERKRKAEMYRLEKKCRSLEVRLELLVPDSSPKLKDAYFQWYAGVFAEGFPVEKRTEKIAPDSARYSDVMKAQADFEVILNEISHSLLQ